MKVNKLDTFKKSKGERLGWKSLSEDKPIELKQIVNKGRKVKKYTYCTPHREYRLLVP